MSYYENGEYPIDKHQNLTVRLLLIFTTHSIVWETIIEIRNGRRFL